MDKVLEVLKIFFYLIILLMALAVLKWLSRFEFTVRDKTIQYEEVIVEDFRKEIGIWDRIKGAETESGTKVIDIGAHDAAYTKFTFLDSIQSQDTGYYEIKYKPMLTQYHKVVLVVESNFSTEFVIDTVDTALTDYTIYKSPILPFSSLKNLQFHKLRHTREELNSFGVSPQEGSIELEYIKFVKQVKPQELF